MEKHKSRAETHSKWSTSGPSGGLPLVPCPKCHVTMIWAVSGSSKNQGKEYYKCPRNDGIYSKQCDTFMWKDKYKRLLSGMHPVEQERRDEPFDCPGKFVDHHVLQQLAAMTTRLNQINDQITKLIQKSSAADEKLKIIVVAFIFLLVGIYIGKIGH